MLQPVRGTKDILGVDAQIKDYILSIFYKVAKQYGFSSIETPIFEYTKVFKRTLGETSDIVGKEMYTFDDRGGESLTLRPEGTAPIIRALISNGLTQTLPQKLMSVGPMFRYERPQKGRCRQFHQASIEYIGSKSPLADVEIISLGYRVLQELGLQNITLNINTLGDVESRSAYRVALIDYFSKYKNELSEDSQIRLEKNPMRILDSKNKTDQEIAMHAPDFSAYLNDGSKDFYSAVKKGLDTLNIPYIIDKSIVRGLDYYTHTAFEFKTTDLGAQDTVLAGGRYDNLSKQMGGPDIASVGFGMGIERIALLMDDTKITQSSPIGILPIGEECFHHALSLANDLRYKGHHIEFPLTGSLNKRFKQLERYNCQYAIIFGTDEWDKKIVNIKNLHETSTDKKEQSIGLDSLSDFLFSLLKI